MRRRKGGSFKSSQTGGLFGLEMSQVKTCYSNTTGVNWGEVEREGWAELGVQPSAELKAIFTAKRV